MNKYILLNILALSALSGYAQDLNSEITVTHQVVPEEQAATRMRLLPKVVLPEIQIGRLQPANSITYGKLSPFINLLEPAPYLTTLSTTPYKGYAALNYGPAYNLNLSAGYQLEKGRTVSNFWLQGDGFSYKSKYPALAYDGQVKLHRTTWLLGARSLTTLNSGSLAASVVYEGSHYNFPILTLGNWQTIKNNINANLGDLNLDWKSKITRNVTYNVAANYTLLNFGGTVGSTFNRLYLNAGTNWQINRSSAASLDLGLRMNHSSLVKGYKNVLDLRPAYVFANQSLTARAGVNVSVPVGNASRTTKRFFIAPDLAINWTANPLVGLYGKVTGSLHDNSRAAIYQEQPYLLGDFIAGYSRLYSGEAGINVGPKKSANLGLFVGYSKAKDWYMPAIPVGYMEAVNKVAGWHLGADIYCAYKSLLTFNSRAEFAPRQGGDFNAGNPLWRDHAKFNLTSALMVRPIDRLGITTTYHLRTHREKVLPQGRALNLRNISNLAMRVAYDFTPQLSASIEANNILCRTWYIGPSVPSQGFVGMIGASYKF